MNVQSLVFISLLSDIDNDRLYSRISADVASGRSSLQHFFGDRKRRQKTFKNAVEPDRVISAIHNNASIGYASFTHSGKGPLVPRLEDFQAEYGRIKGFVNYHIFKRTEPRFEDDALYLYRIAVHQKHRQRGVAKALMQKLDDIARQYHCRTIVLHVAGNNDAAIAVYKSQGFRVTKTRNLQLLRRFFPFTVLYEMKKTLPAPSV